MSCGALNATRFLETYGEVDLKFKLIVHIKESFKMNSRQNTNTNKTFSDRILISTFIFVCFQDDKITVHDLRDIKDGTIYKAHRINRPKAQTCRVYSRDI